MKKNIGMLALFLLVTTGYWGLSNTAFPWPGENGIAISTVSGIKQYPGIVSDGQGGAIIAWYGSGIYCQAINSVGMLKWTLDGVAINTAVRVAQNPKSISDGQGGAIITWNENNNGHGIYAQAVDSTGVIKYPLDGIAISTSSCSQVNQQIVSDGMGGAIITWQDGRNSDSDIYAQAIDSIGTVRWNINGIAICTSLGIQDHPEIISDGQGGAIIVWKDSRNGSSNPDIYVQAVDSTGEMKWLLDGIAICTASGSQEYPNIISDGQGGAVIVWNDYRTGNLDIYAQAIDSSGMVKWTQDGVAICTTTGSGSYSQECVPIVTDELGGAIITWQDSRNGNDHDIYAQAIDNSGVLKWTQNGVAICTASRNQWYQKIESDGQGGAVITWADQRRSESDNDIYAQAIDSNGTVKWITDGIAICTAGSYQEFPQLISNEPGSMIITWQDERDWYWGNWDIYAQSINSEGIVPVKLSGFYCEP
jgi:hypothetical protein